MVYDHRENDYKILVIKDSSITSLPKTAFTIMPACQFCKCLLLLQGLTIIHPPQKMQISEKHYNYLSWDHKIFLQCYSLITTAFFTQLALRIPSLISVTSMLQNDEFKFSSCSRQGKMSCYLYTTQSQEKTQACPAFERHLF